MLYRFCKNSLIQLVAQTIYGNYMIFFGGGEQGIKALTGGGLVLGIFGACAGHGREQHIEGYGPCKAREAVDGHKGHKGHCKQPLAVAVFKAQAVQLEREHAQIAHHEQRQHHHKCHHHPLAHTVVGGIPRSEAYPEYCIGGDGQATECGALGGVDVELGQAQRAKHGDNHGSEAQQAVGVGRAH